MFYINFRGRLVQTHRLRLQMREFEDADGCKFQVLSSALHEWHNV